MADITRTFPSTAGNWGQTLSADSWFARGRRVSYDPKARVIPNCLWCKS